MSAGNGKFYGEGNVHAARWAKDFAAMETAELLALYNNRVRVPGKPMTTWHASMRAELRRRGTNV